jgi:predicted  nucleic acid-binding Zn-ribbon protein
LNTEEEIWTKLRANEPFGKIRTEVHSVSKLYKVAGQYLDEQQTELENIRLQKRQAEEERDRLKAQVTSLRHEIENGRREKQDLQQEISRLNDEVSEKTAKLNSLEERVDRFRAQGFTSEIMGKLEPMIERGGEKLLVQVQNVEKYHQTLKDHACLKKDKASLVRDIRGLMIEKKKASARLVSVKNQVDELRLQARPIKDAVNVVIWLLKRGYTVADVKAMGYGLDFLGVEGDSDLSISRLVTGLKMQKSLVILGEKVTRKLQENTELEKAILDNTMRLKILQETALRAINEVREASIQSLRQMDSERQQGLTTAWEKFDAYLQVSIMNLQVQAKDRVEWVDQQRRRESELAEQKTLFETELKYGRFYQGFFTSDDFLSTISLPWILHISQRVLLWISMKLPNEAIIPPVSFPTQMGIMNWPYNLKTLVELVCLGLEKASKRQSGTPNDGKRGAS